MKITNKNETTDDLVQETFLKLIKNIKTKKYIDSVLHTIFIWFYKKKNY